MKTLSALSDAENDNQSYKTSVFLIKRFRCTAVIEANLIDEKKGKCGHAENQYGRVS